MSLDLVNIAQTVGRLNSQVSNSNVVESNILKLQTLTMTIEQERRKLQKEKTELRKLKKQMDSDKLELQTLKTNMQNQKEMIRHQVLKQKSVQNLNIEQQLQQRKEMRELQKKLAEVSKELTTTKRKLMSAQRKGNGDKEKRYKALERRYLAEKKNNKSLKRELDGAHSELTITRRKLMSATRKGGSSGDSKKYKALLRKWMKQRKKLKLALMELEDRANWYKRQINQFKKKQNKLLKKQKNMLKNKKLGIKYVFIDDVVSVKFHSKFKDRIKVVNKKGKTILVENVKIIHEKSKKKKGKKKGIKDNNFIDDDTTWLESDKIVQELLQDINNLNKETDYQSTFFQTEETNYNIKINNESDNDSEFEDYQIIRGDITEWKEEMEKRDEDMKILMSIALAQNYDANNNKKTDLNFDELISGIIERNQMRFEDEIELKNDINDINDDDINDINEYKNKYDEGMKLLHGNCDEYLNKIKSAISNMKTIVSLSVENNKPRNSIIKRKSMQQSQSLLTPITPDLLTPMSVSSDWSTDQITLFNPDSIVDEISEFYITELNERIRDIQIMNNIFYSNNIIGDKITLLNLEQIIKGIDDRIDDIEDDDKLMVKFIANMQNWKLQFQQYAISQSILIRELIQRRNEIQSLFNVIDITNNSNKALINRINTLSINIDNRHKNVNNIINVSKYDNILGIDEIENKNNIIQEINGDIDDENIEKQNNHYDIHIILENICGFEYENEQWRRFIGKLKAEANNNNDIKQWKSSKINNNNTEKISWKIIENCVKRTMNEIGLRTDDIKQLKTILSLSDAENFGKLLNTIEDRHNKLNETNNDIIKSNILCAEYCIVEDNNNLWWKAIQNIQDILNNNSQEYKQSHESHEMVPDEEHIQLFKKQETVRGLDYNENLKFVLTTNNNNNDIENKKEEEEEEEEELDEEWWLMLDENRNKKIEEIAVTTNENNILYKLCQFVARILKFNTLDDDIVKLYIPIDLNGYPSSQFRCLATLFDGVIISKLLCIINEDLIDFRAINQPLINKAYPLNKNLINENVNVILSSLKSMGMVLNKIYTIADWWNRDKYCELLISLLIEIYKRTMDRFATYKKHSELILLKKKTEPISSLSTFDGEKWIIRWINYMLSRNGLENVDIDTNLNMNKFNKDFMKILTLLKKRNSILLSNDKNQSKSFIKVAKTQFNIDTPIEAKDFTNNNKFCQMYFAAQIFDKMNGLKLDSHNELKEDEKSFFMNDKEKDAILAWINSFGLRNRVDNLDDISSGITLLKVLDRLKKGSVSWNKVHLKVRHKFDHVINCNYVIDIIKKQLGLTMVNTSGMDIVDKNTHIIKSILWRIMRYQSIKILSDLQFGSNISKVNNTEIIKWCNNKILSSKTQINNKKIKTIKKLKDLSLTTGIYYLELIYSIMPNKINKKLINYDIQPLSSSIKNNFNLHDKYYKKRKQNLKYCMTIIRRFGVDLFINVDDLFRLESRAVVSILAALMTISLSQEKLKQKENENNENNNQNNENENENEIKEDIDIDINVFQPEKEKKKEKKIINVAPIKSSDSNNSNKSNNNNNNNKKNKSKKNNKNKKGKERKKNIHLTHH